MTKKVPKSTVHRIRRPRPCGKYRSHFEEQIAEQLKSYGLPVEYEKEKFSYFQPAVVRSYTPDFRVKGFFIEAKGKFDADDRKKHVLLKEQGGPEVRFVFYNAYATLRKGSKTTYAQWCDAHGFKWAHKKIPKDWL